MSDEDRRMTMVDTPDHEDFDAFRKRLAAVEGFEIDEITVELGDFLLLIGAVQAHEVVGVQPMEDNVETRMLERINEKKFA